MRISVLGGGMELPLTLKHRAEIRVWSALKRFAKRVQWATVRFEDFNGPRGGMDKRCRIEVALPRLGTLLAEHTAHDACVALQGAAARLKPLVAQHLKQHWQNRRRRSILARRSATA